MATMKPPVPPTRGATSRPQPPRPTRSPSGPPEPTRAPAASRPATRAGAPTADIDSDSRAAPVADPRNPARPAAAVVAVRRIFAAETGNYFLLLGTTLFLVAFGLVMVLSSSSIESYLQNDSDFFAAFTKQGLYALIGIPLMLLVSRLPLTFFKKWAWLFLVGSMCLQLLVFVPGIGWGYGGNTNWIKIAGISGQPSELVKLALIIWTAWVLWTKAPLLGDWRHVLLPIAPIGGLAIGLVLLGGDLGTAIIMLAIVFGALFFAGVKLRFLALPAILVGFLGLAFALAGGSRSARISAWMTGCADVDTIDACWQPVHGTWALAAGGVFGVGLGNSKAKWSWLPEADNDYIFAIIGEELGLVGAIVVLALFIVLAFAFIRVIRSTDDAFSRIATSGVMIWIVAQALINIAVVLGLLPVLGVPLPLISAGGTALISSLVAIGVVLSFARKPVQHDDSFVQQTPAQQSRLAATERSRVLR